MKKSVFIFLLPLILVFGCNQPQKIVVKGKLFHSNKEWIYLKEMTTVDLVKIDSVQLDKNGEFELSGKISIIGFYKLEISRNNYITLIINPGDRIYVAGDASDLNHCYAVKGSKDSELVKELNDKLNDALDEVSALSKIYFDSIHSPNIMALRNRLDTLYDKIESRQKEYTKAFIRNNTHSLASLMALYQQMGPRKSLLNTVDDYEFFYMVDSVLNLEYPKSDAVISLHSMMADITKEFLKKSEIANSIKVGAIAPEISMLSSKGDSIKLSSMRGKYVLLSFWASYNQNSRDDNKTLPRLFWRYNAKGFTIFQVSLDKDKDSWVNAIYADGLYWGHGCDFKIWNSPVAIQYDVQALPKNFLLDPSGKIIAKDVFGVQLENKLKEIFKY